MNSALKTLLLTTTCMAAGTLRAESPPPATQPSTQPATQPAAPALTQSNAPLVIPDGTSIQNPGPRELRPMREDEGIKLGIRG